MAKSSLFPTIRDSMVGAIHTALSKIGLLQCRYPDRPALETTASFRSRMMSSKRRRL